MGCAPLCADTSRIDLHMCPIAMAAGRAGRRSLRPAAARAQSREHLAHAPRNRAALCALAQAGRRGVLVVDGTRQMQRAEPHARDTRRSGAQSLMSAMVRQAARIPRHAAVATNYRPAGGACVSRPGQRAYRLALPLAHLAFGSIYGA